MSDPTAQPSRAKTRHQLVEVAARLLAEGGPEAVTTRSVAQAAGAQAPTIYRLFGDKSGLLEAVVEYGFETYLAGQRHLLPESDPVADLRAGWDLHIGFGLANPALFRLIHTALATPEGRATAETGSSLLDERIHRVALAGRLRVSERKAADLIHATGTGVVLALTNQPATERDDTLPDTAWASIRAIILTDQPATEAGPSAAAITLRAALPELPQFSEAERGVLTEWLTRLTG